MRGRGCSDRTPSHWFQTHGGLTRANGQRFRDMVLSRGNTLDLAEMYRALAGHDPSIQPYLDYYGLRPLVRLRHADSALQSEGR